MSRIRIALLALFISVSTIVLAGCGGSDGLLPPRAVRYFVAPMQVDCVTMAPRKCLLVREGPRGDWQPFSSHIEGFTYEEGYLYEILVSVRPIPNPPADDSDREYTLIRIVSKTKIETVPF